MKPSSIIRMTLAAAVGCALLPSLAIAQTYSLVVPEADILAVTLAADADPGELAVNPAGLIALVDQQTDNKILFITPGSPNTVVLAATQAQIITAIDNANGTDAAPASITVQSLDFNTDGRLVAYCDGGSPQTATLFTIDTTSPYAINVLSCAANGNPSPIEGGNGMVVLGNDAYLIVDASFGASQDAILRVPTSPVVNDGSASVSTAIGEAALLAATGQDTAANQRINDGEVAGADAIYFVNSGLTASNDNTILISSISTSPSASLYVAATDIEAGLNALDANTTDIGIPAMTVDASGRAILVDGFGDAASIFDEGLIVLDSVAPVVVTSSVTEDAIVAGVGGTVGTNNLVTQGDGADWDSANSRILFVSGTGTDSNTTAIEGVIAVTLPASVADWVMHED